jgi:formylglycine-generating enzyme required for sulfatase activity/tRNA A-37 threonylcarbamoyl transferase component Bud32
MPEVINNTAASTRRSRRLSPEGRANEMLKNVMVEPAVSQLLESLQELELLPAKQLQEASGPLRQQFPATRGLAGEFVRRGWLTSFQVERLIAGEGKSLVLGPYLLLQRLGNGGMGEVFKARHQLLNRIVALKITRKELLTDPTNERRFLREIQATAKLDHPNIVAVHDASRIGETHFFAMEYIDGADLAQLVKKQGPLPVAKACEYIRQAALGLQHAFEQGLVHRDIKPSNLLVTADGSQVKILDLGVARFHDAEGSDLTATGSVVGTPDYLAPEQATNSRSADIRADIYSLGCTLYHLLTGHPPFADGSGLEKVLKHLHDSPPPIRNARGDIPPELAIVIDKMLEKKPADRFQQPSEAAAALAPFCRTEPIAPVAPAPAPAPAKASSPEAPRAPKRRRLLMGSSALLLVVGVALGYWQPWGAEVNAGPKPPFTNSIGMEFVWIPAGSFEMGSPPLEEGRHDDEGPDHNVTITRPLYLASKETTVRQFRTFIDSSHSRTEAEQNNEGALEWDFDKREWALKPGCRWNNPGGLYDGDHPVVCVSRYDAEVFCHWLSNKEHRTYRLPTEAEWEYACRAGSTTAYTFGTAVYPDKARFAIRPTGGPRTDARPHLRWEKVGTFPPNAWGLCDMHGNVWEWCADFYSPNAYQGSTSIDPAGPKHSDKFVARGGSWQNGAAECRSAARLPVDPGTRRNDIGFRVLLEAGVR